MKFLLHLQVSKQEFLQYQFAETVWEISSKITVYALAHVFGFRPRIEDSLIDHFSWLTLLLWNHMTHHSFPWCRVRQSVAVQFGPLLLHLLLPLIRSLLCWIVQAFCVRNYGICMVSKYGVPILFLVATWQFKAVVSVTTGRKSLEQK